MLIDLHMTLKMHLFSRFSGISSCLASRYTRYEEIANPLHCSCCEQKLIILLQDVHVYEHFLPQTTINYKCAIATRKINFHNRRNKIILRPVEKKLQIENITSKSHKIKLVYSRISLKNAHYIVSYKLAIFNILYSAICK